MKALKVFAAALVGVAAGAAATARAASIVNLTIQAVPNAGNTGGTWKAFADVEDTTSAGLHGIQFDVTVSGAIALGGVNVNDFNDLPVGTVTIPSGRATAVVAAGYHNFNAATNVTATDEQFRGAQDNLYTAGVTAGHSNIVFGFGLPAQSGTIVGDTTIPTPPGPWSFPALIADGTYTGSSGSLMVSGSAGNTTLLPLQATVLNSGTTGFATHSPDTVNPGTTTIGGVAAVPTPAAAVGGLLLLSIVAGARRHRRA